MTENELATIVFNAGLRVHRTLGPGLLESAYEACLFYELNELNLRVEKQKILPLVYRGEMMDIGYRIDLIVENRLILEIKSVKELTDLHMEQVLSYLKLSDCKLGLLINFNVELFKTGVKRVVNRL